MVGLAVRAVSMMGGFKRRALTPRVELLDRAEFSVDRSMSRLFDAINALSAQDIGMMWASDPYWADRHHLMKGGEIATTVTIDDHADSDSVIAKRSAGLAAFLAEVCYDAIQIEGAIRRADSQYSSAIRCCAYGALNVALGQAIGDFVAGHTQGYDRRQERRRASDSVHSLQHGARRVNFFQRMRRRENGGTCEIKLDSISASCSVYITSRDGTGTHVAIDTAIGSFGSTEVMLTGLNNAAILESTSALCGKVIAHCNGRR